MTSAKLTNKVISGSLASLILLKAVTVAIVVVKFIELVIESVIRKFL